MSLLSFLKGNRKKTARLAKERLQIILAHERSDRNGPDYLPAMRKELLQVVSKYVNVDLDQVKINLDRDGDYDILELNVVLPEPSRHDTGHAHTLNG